jgi:eukaryotic-like serine/threonine-protein kinase
MKKVFILLCLCSLGFGQVSYAQTEFSVPWAIFHGCERHCGIYPASNYVGFSSLNWMFQTNGKIFSSPAVYNGVVYTGSDDQYLYAIDATSGKELWKFKTGGAVHSSPSIFNNRIYFGSFDGYYYALDAKTGAEKWKFKTGGEKWVDSKEYGFASTEADQPDLWQFFLSSPVISPSEKAGLVYFGSSDGFVYALDAESGNLKWKFKTGGPMHSSPAIHKGMLFIGSWDNYLYALDAQSGKEIWKFKTGEKALMHGIQASPSVDNESVYFGARDANFYSLDLKTGQLNWKYPADNSWILSTAGIKDGTVYFGTSDSFLFLALDAKTGKEKYRMTANGYIYSSPALANKTAFFGDFTGKVFAVDMQTGQKLDEFATTSRGVNAKNILKDDKLNFQYAASGMDASLYKTSKVVMDKFYALGAVVSSPAVVGGVIYFGSSDGRLYAVKLKSGSELFQGASQHGHH